MPDAPGLELIRGEIDRDYPGAVLATSFDRAQAALIVDPERVLEVLRWLAEQPGHRYDFLSSLHAADYLPAEPRFAVHYELINRDRVERIRVKAMLGGGRPAGPVTAGDPPSPATAQGMVPPTAPPPGETEEELPEIPDVPQDGPAPMRRPRLKAKKKHKGHRAHAKHGLITAVRPSSTQA